MTVTDAAHAQPPATQESGEAGAQEAVDELQQLYRKYMRELVRLREQVDTILVLDTGEVLVTLHQLKVRDLDAELTQLRRQLGTTRQQQQFLEHAGEPGMEPAILAWLLRQEEQVIDPAATDDSPEATIQRHRAWLRWKIDKLDAAVQVRTEEFKFHYEKARRLDQIAQRERDLHSLCRSMRDVLLLQAIVPARSRVDRNRFVETMYRETLEDYSKLLEEFNRLNDSVPIVSGPDAASVMTLQGLKIRELDSHLNEQRANIAGSSMLLRYLDAVMEGDEAVASTAMWILIQEKVLRPPSGADRDLSARETLERLHTKTKRELEAADEQYQVATEEFKFRFVQAKQLESARWPLAVKLEDLHTLLYLMDVDRRIDIAEETGIPPPQSPREMSDSQTEALKEVLAEVLPRVGVPDRQTPPTALPQQTGRAGSETLSAIIGACEQMLAAPDLDSHLRDHIELKLEAARAQLGSLQEKDD